MGNSHETTSAVEDEFGLSPTQGTIQDRMLHLLGRQGVSEAPEKAEANVDQQRLHADPREQILTLYDEFRPRLFRYLRSMKMDRDQAEEVIQETFMRLTTELVEEKDIENVQGWIVRVAHNLAVDVLKKKDREAIHLFERSFDFEDRIDPALSPEEAYLKKEQIRRMDLALTTFNPQQRHCFHMRVQGFRYTDIGLALGISEQRAAFVLKQVAVRLAAICG
jgi:RNA polymerase sigma-70 factor (ECF subfamily)